MDFARLCDIAFGILCIVIGLGATLGGLFGWNWYLNLRPARRVVDAIGRTGARWFYFFVGCVIVAIGVLFCLGEAPFTFAKD